MKGEIYYREKYPKEFRILLQNEDEIKFLKLLFNNYPKGLLKKFTVTELDDAGVSAAWRKKFIAAADKADIEEPYSTYSLWEALDNELENIQNLEDASHV